MPELKPFAAFDVDGTIFKSSLTEKVVDGCIDAGLFQPEAFTDAFDYRRRWENSNNEDVYQTYLRHLVNGFIREIVDVKVGAFQEVTTAVVEEQRVRRFAFPRMVMDHLRDSHYLVAISGSPDIVVRPFLEDLDMHASYGTKFRQANGRFTGQSTPMLDKATVIANLKHRNKVSSEGSIAIGDTVADIPILDDADTSIMFNASHTLTNMGRHLGWYRVNEVKDEITAMEASELDSITAMEASECGTRYSEITVDQLLSRI